MSKFSINFKKVSTHSFKHNDRTEIKKADTVFAQFTDRNICDISAKEAQQNLDNYYDEAMSKIEGRVRRAKRENTLIEAVVNVKKNTTIEDLKKLQVYIEKEYVFTGLQIAIHKDEGHFEDDKFIENYHAHMSFFTLNRSNGRQMFRKEHINPDKLRQLQTDGAQILNMDRGRDKRESGIERLEHREHKRAKKAEEKHLAKIEDLKAEIVLLKKLAETREQHASIEQLNRDLKQQVKDKDLTIEDLHKRINAHTEYINTLQSKNEALVREKIGLTQKIDSRVNIEDLTTEINEDVKQILDLEKINLSRFNIKSIVKFLKDKYFELVKLVGNLSQKNRELETKVFDLEIEHKKNVAHIQHLERGYKALEKMLGGNDMKVEDIVEEVKDLKAEQGHNAVDDFMDENSEYIPPKAYRSKS